MASDAARATRIMAVINPGIAAAAIENLARTAKNVRRGIPCVFMVAPPTSETGT
jgi:hypothetical protein